jgi:hypothetical protein
LGVSWPFSISAGASTFTSSLPWASQSPQLAFAETGITTQNAAITIGAAQQSRYCLRVAMR